METPLIHCHLLCYNEKEILPWTLRHYGQFCAKIIVHDLGSTDFSQDIAALYEATVVQHDCKGQFDDRLNKRLKETTWQTEKADWVICADADEMLHFPAGVVDTLRSYEQQNVAVVKTHGYEMLEDTYPQGEGQITGQVKNGGKDDYWYGKPILFNPRLVKSLEFATGAHTVKALLKNGRILTIEHKSAASIPPTYLLHFHHLGGVERIGRLYNENRARQSAENKRHKWGLQEDGFVHAKRKRDGILPHLGRVAL